LDVEEPEAELRRSAESERWLERFSEADDELRRDRRERLSELPRDLELDELRELLPELAGLFILLVVASIACLRWVVLGPRWMRDERGSRWRGQAGGENPRGFPPRTERVRSRYRASLGLSPSQPPMRRPT